MDGDGEKRATQDAEEDLEVVGLLAERKRQVGPEPAPPGPASLGAVPGALLVNGLFRNRSETTHLPCTETETQCVCVSVCLSCGKLWDP